MRGNYPYFGSFGLPKYLHNYLIQQGFAVEKEITWSRPMTSQELAKAEWAMINPDNFDDEH
jgi:hypothetical protein